MESESVLLYLYRNGFTVCRSAEHKLNWHRGMDTMGRHDGYASEDKLAIYSQVAHMYYELNMLQPEIAKKLYFSRSKVSRLLQKAQDLGIVDIKVKHYLSRVASYENALKSKFNIRMPVVLTSFEGDRSSNANEGLNNYAAVYISEKLKGNFVFGITGSHNVTRAVHQLKKRHDCNLKVVQTIGASINQDMSADLVDFLAQTFDGKAYFLNTPVYVADLDVKAQLMRDPGVLDALCLMKKCDLILMSIGTFDVNGDMPNWWGYMTEQHRIELDRLGAVGSICAQFFDKDGNWLDCEWNRKCISIPWEDMKAAGERVVIVHGPHKVRGILGALRGGLINVLITDTITAAAVLDLQDKWEHAARQPFSF